MKSVYKIILKSLISEPDRWKTSLNNHHDVLILDHHNKNTSVVKNGGSMHVVLRNDEKDTTEHLPIKGFWYRVYFTRAMNNIVERNLSIDMSERLKHA